MKGLVVALIVLGLAPPPIQRPKSTEPAPSERAEPEAVEPTPPPATPEPAPEAPDAAPEPTPAPAEAKPEMKVTPIDPNAAPASSEADYSELPRFDEVDPELEVTVNPESEHGPDPDELARQWEKSNQPDRYRDGAIGTGAIAVILTGGAVIVATTAPCGRDGSQGGDCSSDPRVQASIGTAVIGGIGVVTAIALGIVARRQKLRSQDTARVRPTFGPGGLGLAGRF